MLAQDSGGDGGGGGYGVSVGAGDGGSAIYLLVRVMMEVMEVTMPTCSSTTKRAQVLRSTSLWPWMKINHVPAR